MPDWQVALAMMALVIIAAAIQAHAGFGFALFLVPYSAWLIGPRETVLLATLLAIATNGLQAVRLRRHAIRRTAGLLAAGSFVGMPIGVGVLLFANPAMLKGGTAIAVLGATLLVGRGASIPARSSATDMLAGMVSGVLNTSTGISGPPVAIYLQGRVLPPREFRGTIAAFFLMTTFVALALLSLTVSFDTSVLAIAALCLPSLVLGNTLGNLLFHRTSEAVFRRAVLAVLILSGTAALIGAATELF
ncbi:MAG: sulfite exporter TauE/SafE family protein [Hyphomicrobiales bacterium]